MPLRPQDLARDLDRGGLRPVYIVSGDELLLVQEACDQIIAAARAKGFDERVLIQVETGFQWHELTEQANTMSLFAQRRLLDVRMPPKFDKDAVEALLAYLANPPVDTLLLLRTERLDSKQRASAWFKKIEAVGAAVLVWPIGPKELPGWLAQRAKRARLELSDDALGYLAHSVEGNLLAAAQEIEKLALADLAQPVTLAALTSAITDAAHYDAFDLVDAALEGEARRVRHIVWVLRAEGVAVLAILGAVSVQLRRFLNDDTRGLPQAKERAMHSAAKRLRKRDIEDLLAQAARVDQQVKGAAEGDPWQTLEYMALRLAGVTDLGWLATA